MMRGSERLMVVIAAILLISGCSDPRRKVPGHLASGNVDQVTRRAGGLGEDRLMELGLVPIEGYVPATVPLVEAPQVASIWFFPRHSGDGRSEREGHWVHTQVGMPRFYRDRALHEHRIPLDRLHDVQIGPDGRPHVVIERPMAGQLRRPEAGLSRGPIMPWQPGTEEETRTTVIVETPRSGGPPARQVVSQQSGPSSPLTNPDGTPNQAAISQMVDDVNRRILQGAREAGQED